MSEPHYLWLFMDSRKYPAEQRRYFLHWKNRMFSHIKIAVFQTYSKRRKHTKKSIDSKSQWHGHLNDIYVIHMNEGDTTKCFTNIQ